MPKVSVILTSYNHEKFIAESIESVLNQTYNDYELIIWDDCSQDNSFEIIKKYSKKDNRIKIFRNEKNIYGVINQAVKVAKGKYIAIIHSDDRWKREKLEKQVDFIENNTKYAAVFTLVELINDYGEIFTDAKHSYFNIFNKENRNRFDWLNHFFYKGNCLCHPSVLIKKECYENIGFDYRFAQFPDFNFWIKVCLEEEIFILQEKLTEFRMHKDESNESAATPDVISRAAIELVEILKNFLKIKSVDEFKKVFPKYEHFNINEKLIPFYIAKEALTLSESHQLFGILTLYELFEKEKDLLEKELNFSYKELKELTKTIDPFNKKQLINLEKKINILENSLENKIIKSILFFPKKTIGLLKKYLFQKFNWIFL